MKLQPGDQIQIILTVGGVPYAKTCLVEEPISKYQCSMFAAGVFGALMTDIDQYGEEEIGVDGLMQ